MKQEERLKKLNLSKEFMYNVECQIKKHSYSVAEISASASIRFAHERASCGVELKDSNKVEEIRRSQKEVAHLTEKPDILN